MYLTLEDGDPAGGCKGLANNDIPRAHLFGISSHTAQKRRRAREIVDNLDVFAECEVWLRVEHGDYGPRQYARLTDRVPGTAATCWRAPAIS